MVQIAEAGDDNALQTIDSGKYYTVSSLKTVRGIANHHVVNAKKAEIKLDRLKGLGDKIDPVSVKDQELKVKVFVLI